MNKTLPILSALFLASTPALPAQTPTDSTSTTRSVDLIDPAAFGFGRPGHMVDTTFIDTQDLANRPDGLDFSWDVEDPAVNRVEHNGWQTAASVIYQATDRFSISLRAGVNIGGLLELRDGNNNVLANETLESAPFGALKLRWQF
ncbi:MAG: hypothetical protein HS117_03780 [Verrucomicrobiaceae bacterium]|jgi:hypothetical protein|nr:hypothetical protein [Verrucomicrobiaceae bacterium]